MTISQIPSGVAGAEGAASGASVGTAGDGGFEVRHLPITDPAAEPLLSALTQDYTERYGPLAGQEMARFPADEFDAPDGAFILLFENGEAVAGGAFRRYDAETAELKRIWTRADRRRRGLARRVLDVLELTAAERGYRRIHLTTGPLQPEAKGLYLATGYTPLFDAAADPPEFRPLPFEKDLVG